MFAIQIICFKYVFTEMLLSADDDLRWEAISPLSAAVLFKLRPFHPEFDRFLTVYQSKPPRKFDEGVKWRSLANIRKS